MWQALIEHETYRPYAESIADLRVLEQHGKRMTGLNPIQKSKAPSSAKKMFLLNGMDGTPNACWNCVDRHLKNMAIKSLSWEGDEPDQSANITYKQLQRSLPIANTLKANGVRKGDRVTIYMMIPEAAYAMLACARIGLFIQLSLAASRPRQLLTYSRL